MADSDIQPTGSDEEEEVPELDPEQQEQAQASFFDAQDTTGQQQGRLSPATSGSGSISSNNSIGTMSASANAAAPPNRSVTVLSLSDRFEDEDPRDPSTLTGGMVTLKRDERGTDAKDIDKNKRRATDAVDLLFQLPDYQRTRLISGDNTDQSTDKQSLKVQLVSVEATARKLERRAKQYDFANVAMIPHLLNENATRARDRWDGTKPAINLFRHAKMLSLDQVKQWSADNLLNNNKKDPEIERDLEWLLELVRNSCDEELRFKLDEKFEKLPYSHQSGVVYLKMVFDTLINLASDDVVDSMIAHITKFRDEGMLMFPGQNVERMKLEIGTYVTRLWEAGRLPNDAFKNVIKGLSKCEQQEFAKKFADYLTMMDNSLISATFTTIPGSNDLERINAVLDEAEQTYEALFMAQKWVNVGLSAHACFNCDDPTHGVDACKKPHDEARIEARKEAFFKKKKEGRAFKGISGGFRKGQRSTSKNGYERGKWSPPKQNESIVKKIGNAHHCWCGACAHWTKGTYAHSTGYHADATKAKSNGDSFELNPEHPWKTKGGGRNSSNRNSRNRNNGNNNDGGDEKKGSGGIDHNKASSYFEKLEKNTSEPEEVRMANMMKSFHQEMSKG